MLFRNIGRLAFAVCVSISTISIGSASLADDVFVNGYVKKDGTYVAPHYRSAPNYTKSDNWSQVGNTNPYTGEEGTKDCGLFCLNNGTLGNSSQNGSLSGSPGLRLFGD
jgi:hypothetical protein